MLHADGDPTFDRFRVGLVDSAAVGIHAHVPTDWRSHSPSTTGLSKVIVPWPQPSLATVSRGGCLATSCDTLHNTRSRNKGTPTRF